MAKGAIKPANAIDYKQIAESIAKVSNAAVALDASGLTRRATTVLLSHATGLPMKTVSLVLDAAESLKSWCLKQ